MSDLRPDDANILYYGSLVITRSRVTAEVDHGLVTLQGVVERAYQRYAQEAIVRRDPARSVSGMKLLSAPRKSSASPACRLSLGRCAICTTRLGATAAHLKSSTGRIPLI